MRIEYTFYFGDYLVFATIHQIFSPVVHGLYLLLAMYIFSDQLIYGSATNSFLVAAIWYCALWFAQFLYNALYLYSRRSNAVLTKHVIELRDDALYESTKFNESRFFWPGIHKIVRRPGFVAVYTTPIQAHIVPKRAFSSNEQMTEFVATVRRKIGP
jgi:hypothetical protein